MIAIIGCGKAKLKKPARAMDLYIGSLFKAQYRYAKRAGCFTIYILSAKYGLVTDRQIVAPYDVTVARFNRAEVAAWCESVAGQLESLPSGKILALVSSRYELALKPRASDLINPLRGLPLGKRMQFLARSES